MSRRSKAKRIQIIIIEDGVTLQFIYNSNLVANIINQKLLKYKNSTEHIKLTFNKIFKFYDLALVIKKSIAKNLLISKIKL